jgi:hypothetical protein
MLELTVTSLLRDLIPTVTLNQFEQIADCPTSQVFYAGSVDWIARIRRPMLLLRLNADD